MKMILERTTENHGSGTYSIELDLEINNGSQDVNLKETWLVENDKTLKVTIQGQNELKGLLVHYLYVGGQRWSKRNNQKESKPITEEFLEKWNHFRNEDSMKNAMLTAKMILPKSENSKNKKSNSTDNSEEEFLKLTRSQNVVNYGFGEVKSDHLLPRLWIEQDAFIIRKLRLASGVEVTMDNYRTYSKNFHYPRERTIKWGSNSVTIKTISVQAKAGNLNSAFSTKEIELNNQADILFNHPLKTVIEEFYSQYR